jgi:glycerophosphoryl diester phosphodiesterase
MKLILKSLIAGIVGMTLSSITSAMNEIDLQGHRGARGLFPENTLAAFHYALDQGMTTLELDLHYLENAGQFVLFHDHVITAENARTAEESALVGRQVHTLTLDELETIDVGSFIREDFPQQKPQSPQRPLLLREFLDAIRKKDNSVRFNIELKLSETQQHTADLPIIATRLLDTIAEYQIEAKTTIQSFYHPFLLEAKTLAPDQTISALFSPSRWQGLQMWLGLPANRKEILQKTIDLGAEILSPHHYYCSSDFLDECHQHGIKVIPWTVNDPKRMQQLFDRGVDGIISDYPNLLKEAYILWKPSSKSPEI